VPIPVQFARLIQSATGIILLSQVVIATSDDTEKLMDHVEGLLVATSQTQFFQRAPGVISMVSGYMQGAETIQITFDPSKTSYDKLLNLFWRAHNPTEVDSQ
jgi:hypothetical protein